MEWTGWTPKYHPFQTTGIEYNVIQYDKLTTNFGQKIQCFIDKLPPYGSRTYFHVTLPSITPHHNLHDNQSPQ